MERRGDSLLREVVRQVALSSRTRRFNISARRSQGDTTGVDFARRDPRRIGRQQFIRLSHVAAEQYLAADIWPSLMARWPTATRLWSYHPTSGRYTARDNLPTAVRAWVETAL
jgi:hypothetical protein